MPEGDTIHRTATVLRTALVGHRLVRFMAPRWAGVVPRAGAAVESVVPTGKHLEIFFDDGLVLHTHLRMTGSWHVYRPGEQWRRSRNGARVVIEVDGWTAVCFNAPIVEVYRELDRRRHPALGALGPDLCAQDVDVDACVDRVSLHITPSTSIAELLTDQRVAAGVGNVYKSEVLWACRVHPSTPVTALSSPVLRELFETASFMLRANLHNVDRVTAMGGLAVYHRAGKRCLRCHTPIEWRRHGEHARVTFFCPRCQALPDGVAPVGERADAAAAPAQSGSRAARPGSPNAGATTVPPEEAATRYLRARRPAHAAARR